MQEIQIGAVIAQGRKQGGITQEELAKWVGVSKAAVSKWESGSSFPDIHLLPLLASYFGISMDALLQYQPTMTTEAIRKAYFDFAKRIGPDTASEVHEELRELVRRYYACGPLVFHMGIFLLNHLPILELQLSRDTLIREAQKYFQHVEQSSKEPSLEKQARHLRGACHLLQGEPLEVKKLLDGTQELPLSTEVLLATAMMELGETQEACTLLQSAVYKNLISILGAIPSLLSLYRDHPKKLKDWVGSVTGLMEAFDIRDLHPAAAIPIHLHAAMLFSGVGRTEEALLQVEAYADLLCKPGLFPLELHGNELFDHIEAVFEQIQLGTQAPVNAEAVKNSFKKMLDSGPQWHGLEKEARFYAAKKRIECL